MASLFDKLPGVGVDKPVVTQGPSPMLLKMFENNFAPNISHKMELIREQSENGLYTIKRAGAYLKKICAMIRALAAEAIKTTGHELEKKDRLERDMMPEHLDALLGAQSLINQQFVNQLKWANDVQKDVVDPLIGFYKQADEKRKRLVMQDDKYRMEMKNLALNVSKMRSDCLKEWKQLQECEKEKIGALEEALAHQNNPKLATSSFKKKEKTEKALQKQRERTHKIFAKFEVFIMNANEDQKLYYTKDLPNLCASFEMLELERLEELNARMKDFARITSELSTPMPGLAESFSNVVATMQTKQAIKSFTTKYVDQHGKPPSIEPFKENLPCSANIVHAYSEQLKSLLSQDIQSSIASARTGQTPMKARQQPKEDPDEKDDEKFGPDPDLLIVRARYDFSSEDQDDLRFDPGDLLLVTSPGVKPEDIGEEAGEGAWLEGCVLDTNHMDNSVVGSFPSNYVELAPLDNEITLRVLVEFPSGLRRFTSFLKQEYSQENIEFWAAVQEFRHLPEEELEAAAQTIMGRYIANSATEQVNIKGPSKVQLESMMKDKKINRYMFDKAQKEIFELLSRDSFPRFKKQPAFTKYLQKMGGAVHTRQSSNFSLSSTASGGGGNGGNGNGNGMHLSMPLSPTASTLTQSPSSPSVSSLALASPVSRQSSTNSLNGDELDLGSA